MTRDEIVCLAQSGVGFSYWWGGECWCRTGCNPDYSCGKGTCTGVCPPPDCSHSGPHGADCSGFVSKVWQVPNAVGVEACGADRYVASSFHASGAHWDKIAWGDARKADAFASTGHVFLYERGDPWGSPWVYEARGCSYGIVHRQRSIDSSYSAARRHNLVACSGPCSPGEKETQDCCDCGKKTRTCAGDCTWGAWGACNGPDPGGGAQACDTGQEGPCAEGKSRCREGCLVCVPNATATEERCDTVDNDCDGALNNGPPERMGTTPPRWSARVEDVSFPASLAAGERGELWLEIVNTGSETWPAGEVALTLDMGAGYSASRLQATGEWPSPAIPARIGEAVAPGVTVRLAAPVVAPLSPGEEVAETFTLADPSGAFMECPAPSVTVEVAVLPGGGDGAVEPAADASTDTPRDTRSGGDAASDGSGLTPVGGVESGCACSVTL